MRHTQYNVQYAMSTGMSRVYNCEHFEIENGCLIMHDVVRNPKHIGDATDEKVYDTVAVPLNAIVGEIRVTISE